MGKIKLNVSFEDGVSAVELPKRESDALDRAADLCIELVTVADQLDIGNVRKAADDVVESIATLKVALADPGDLPDDEDEDAEDQ